MEVRKPQFTGSPVGQSGGHKFYSKFRYTTPAGRTKELSVGEFFFVRMSACEDPCIGEIQLLCTSRNGEQSLAALRLYFLPEQTPEGRMSHHGEHEVLVANGRVVLKLDDLAGWVTEEVEWNHGIVASTSTARKEVVEEEEEEKKVEVKKGEPLNDNNNNNTSSASSDHEQSSEKLVMDIKEEDIQESSNVDSKEPKESTHVRILSYQDYCRYRTMLKRLEGGDTSQWLQDAVVVALGGIAPPPPSQKTHVLFVRDTFDHDELEHHELNCDYLAPAIKGKRKKKKTKTTRSMSPESITSDECKAIEVKKNQKPNGPKQPPIKNEQEFLQRLFRFMKKRNTPIHRVPHLGFKQIDMHVFYTFSQKLGGYDKITSKRLWKHVYDELGGNPGSTSAATCTRRHYERLLLPFERFMAGITYKPAQRGKKSQKKKQQQLEQQQKQEQQQLEELKQETKENLPSNSNIPTKAEVSANLKAEAEEIYAFTDSNHENSRDSNEFNIVCEEEGEQTNNTNECSDEDSKTVWSIQKQPDNKDETSQDKDEGKHIKPLIIQKGQGETFAEKERKWDEIRRKNAAARKWVRQSRSSSRGCKTPVPEIPPFKQEKNTPESTTTEGSTPATTVKTEIPDATANQINPLVSSPSKVVSETKIPSTPPSHKDSPTKFLSPSSTPELPNGKVKSENHTPKRRHILANQTPSHLTADKKYMTVAKTETRKHSNSWCGYSANSEHSSSYQLSLHSGVDGVSPGAGKLPYKAGTRSEPGDYPLHTGRHSVGSMSASSIVSAEAASGEDKPLVPQRRPSVIQHTEYAATSPSPSPSPREQGQDMAKNVSPKECSVANVPFSSPKINLLPSQTSYSMTGKVADWLTKGIHEVVACKTPSTAVEKNMELHDKVMMPSSCKTPGAVGTSKVPVKSSKASKQGNASKSPRSKYARQNNKAGANSNYNNVMHKNDRAATNGNYNNVMHKNDKANHPIYSQKSIHPQKMFHPLPTPYPVMSNAPPKYQHTINQKVKAEFYPNGPYYNQPKRTKMNNVLPSALPPVVHTRPSLSPFVRGTTYCTPPLGDIPKITAITHNDYESAVLDLSVKRKPAQTAPPKPPPPPMRPVSPVPEGVCLDLSVKKNNNNTLLPPDNGIENITPPLSLSPHPPSMTFMNSSLKPLPTLISLQDMEESARRSYHRSSTVTAPMAMPPIQMHPQMYSAAHNSKLPVMLANSVPPIYSQKDMAKNLYNMPGGNSRHTQFPPYVIPPFFPTNWTSVVSTPTGNAKQASNSQTSPMAYKGMVNHSVFPKDYPYNIKSQFHPVLCKDNGHYPSNDNK